MENSTLRRLYYQKFVSRSNAGSHPFILFTSSYVAFQCCTQTLSTQKRSNIDTRGSDIKMDVNDVSDNIEFIAALRKAQNLARLADQRKGQLVQDHPNPEFLIAKHIKDLMGSDIRAVTGITSNVTTSQLLHPYPPCIKPLSELKPINISKLNLETHHRGYWTLLRILTQPRRCMAVMAVVEDVENTAVLLQLHNQPDENLVPAKNVLRWKSFCIVKEPLFKCAMDGAYLLRVDHPSDVIWLDDSDERLPLRWRKAVLTLDGGSQELRAKGNEAVQRKRWAEAERL